MKNRLYQQCWFWLAMIFFVLVGILVTLVSHFFPDFHKLICNVDFWTIISSMITMFALLLSAHIFRDERKRECQRATLADFVEFRETNEVIGSADDDSIMAYMRKAERFAVGVNKGAYDIEIINRMSGGLLVEWYQKDIKDFIIRRRKEKSSFISSEQKYCEYEEMMKKIYKLRGIKWEK